MMRIQTLFPLFTAALLTACEDGDGASGSTQANLTQTSFRPSPQKLFTRQTTHLINKSLN